MTSVTTTAGTLETRPISGGRSLPIGAAKVGGGLAGGADVVFQLLDTGKVDWMRAGAFGALGGLSSYSGIRSGSAMQKAIIRNRVALESNLSKSMLSRLTSGLLAGGGS